MSSLLTVKIVSIIRTSLNLTPASRYIVRRMSALAENTPTTSPYKGRGLLAILENNPKRLQRVKFLGKLFETGGYELRIAGGAVRDILRGVEPQDIDFATTARPEESLKLLEKHQDILRIIVTASGQRHGTVAVKFKETDIDFNKRIKLSKDVTQNEQIDDQSKSGDQQKNSSPPKYDEESPFEITTLRCDSSTDGRHAEVEFINDWRIDAERRDLTINAMFLTLDEGKLIDYFDGESDLKNGVVKFVGDADRRIKEDYLRILRFFRFWSRYGKNKQPDPETIKTLQANLDGLNKISGERLWVEIKKTLSHFPCDIVVELMFKLRLFDYVGMKTDNKSDEDYDGWVKTVLEELRVVQRNVKNYSETTLEKRLREEPDSKKIDKMKELMPVILFTPIVQSLDMLANAHNRMKFSNIERDSILYIFENREKNFNVKALKNQLALTHVPERPLMMSRMRALLVYLGKFDIIDELESWQVPNFPFTGQAVAQEVRKRKLPGDKIKTIIESLKESWAISEFKLGREELEKLLHEKLDQLTNK